MVLTPSRLHRRPHKPCNTHCCTHGCTLTLCHPACRQNEDEGEELTPWGEQEAWEAHQVAQASMKTGAQDKRAQQEYDLVLPDAVEFIAAQAIQGTLVRPPAMSHRLVQVAGCRLVGWVAAPVAAMSARPVGWVVHLVQMLVRLLICHTCMSGWGPKGVRSEKEPGSHMQHLLPGLRPASALWCRSMPRSAASWSWVTSFGTGLPQK